MWNRQVQDMTPALRSISITNNSAQFVTGDLIRHPFLPSLQNHSLGPGPPALTGGDRNTPGSASYKCIYLFWSSTTVSGAWPLKERKKKIQKRVDTNLIKLNVRTKQWWLQNCGWKYKSTHFQREATLPYPPSRPQGPGRRGFWLPPRQRRARGARRERPAPPLPSRETRGSPARRRQPANSDHRPPEAPAPKPGAGGGAKLGGREERA